MSIFFFLALYMGSTDCEGGIQGYKNMYTLVAGVCGLGPVQSRSTVLRRRLCILISS